MLEKTKIILKHIKATALIAIAFTIFSCAPSRSFLLKNGSTRIQDKSYIKVLIKKSRDRVLVQSEKKIKISYLKTRGIVYRRNGIKRYYYPEQVKVPILIESWSPMAINGKKYRGMIELHNIMGKIYVINVLRMDEYLFGVVPSEIPSSWGYESLKAQAVAARTYAYYHVARKKNILYDVDGTTNFQVYRGFSVETENTNKAVAETSGEIIAYHNQPIIAYFHSTCGGRTIDDKFVWGTVDMEYLKGIRCRYCKSSPKYMWKVKISLYEIRKKISRSYRGIRKITGISFKKHNGRVISVRLKHTRGSIKINGNKFRLLISPVKIQSLFFSARKYRKGLLLSGRGWGHGVGMCQWGARGMAENGASYRDIIRFYYKEINLVKVDKTTPGNRKFLGRISHK